MKKNGRHFCNFIPGNTEIKYGPKNSIEFVGYFELIGS
jgi:hypothetical protein